MCQSSWGPRVGLGGPGVSCLTIRKFPISLPSGAQQGRCRRDARAHAFPQVARDPRGDLGAAAVDLEARGVRPEPLAPSPQMRVVDAALVGEQGVMERPELALGGGGL